MGRIRHALMALGVVTMLIVSGCGGTAAPQQAAPTSEDSAADAGPTEDTKMATGRTTADYPTQTNEACDVLTQDVAKSVLGDVGEAAQPPPPTSTEDVSVTSCVRANSAASKTPRSVSLLMRVARNVTGAIGNESVFAPETLPDGAQKVTGYGEAAFWNPGFGQLNVLKDGNWYILAAGPIDPTKHTLAEAQTLADAVIDKL